MNARAEEELALTGAADVALIEPDDVLSELARAALTGAVPTPRDPDSTRHGFRPLPRRGPAVSNSLVDELRDEEGA